ncbi:9088_t:CDS:2, partial [Racocetra persica]
LLAYFVFIFYVSVKTDQNLQTDYMFNVVTTNAALNILRLSKHRLSA